MTCAWRILNDAALYSREYICGDILIALPEFCVAIAEFSSSNFVQPLIASCIRSSCGFWISGMMNADRARGYSSSSNNNNTTTYVQLKFFCISLVDPLTNHLRGNKFSDQVKRMNRITRGEKKNWSTYTIKGVLAKKCIKCRYRQAACLKAGLGVFKICTHLWNQSSPF